MSADTQIPVVFSPANEPYLGRRPLYVLDKLISAVLEENSKTAPLSHKMPLSDPQRMAAQLIPQSISIALSMRELIRQGYLFGGHVLLRPLAERVSILLYVHHNPAEIEVWNRGWNHKEAPSLAKMFESFQAGEGVAKVTEGWRLTAPMNSLVHGKPDSAPWATIPLDETGKLGHAPSKLLSRPDLCDDLCKNVIPWLSIVPAMMAAYFPNEPAT